MSIREFDAREVKRVCNGMLLSSIYDLIYRKASNTKNKCFLEIGAAHGAVTVCLGRAILESGGDGRIFTIDKFVGGSREKYGGRSENIGILESNLANFSIRKYVKILPGEVEDVADLVPDDVLFDGIVLDADGRIDRDFDYFFDRLRIGSLIFIDDVANLVRIKPGGLKGLSREMKLDQKHRLTYLLLELFKKYRLVDTGVMVGPNTWMGKKLGGRFSDVPSSEILSVYRQLVFGKANVSLIPFRSVAGDLLRILGLRPT